MSGGIVHGQEVTRDRVLRTDAVVIGSGAGGAVVAAGLAARGLRVVILEAGGAYTKADFDGDEHRAFQALYQGRGLQATADQAIGILQGRGLGGSTAINWTTCFRTPPAVLEHWARVHEIPGLDGETLRPHFEAVEARLNIRPWPETAANANNRALLDGCRALGWAAEPLRRNVRGCAASGYCGQGCPVDAKQAMHLTYLADAVADGAVIHVDCPVTRLEVEGGKVVAVHGQIIDRQSHQPTGGSVVVHAERVIVAGGAIHSPALLLRSGLNANGRVGKRTYIHPVVGLFGRHADPIQGYHGAPQAVGSHHHAFPDDPDEYGYFIEVAPTLPMMMGLAVAKGGDYAGALLRQLPHLSMLIALQIDGFREGDEGGTVSLRRDGRIRIDYPVGRALARGFQRAHHSLARIHLAAGAQVVSSLHGEPVEIRSEADLPELDRRSYGAHHHSIFTAHQMGGCAMGIDPATSVVSPSFRHHEVMNLYVVDGSVLPTSLGVNPSETIYGLARSAADPIAR